MGYRGMSECWGCPVTLRNGIVVSQKRPKSRGAGLNSVIRQYHFLEYRRQGVDFDGYTKCFIFISLLGPVFIMGSWGSPSGLPMMPG